MFLEPLLSLLALRQIFTQERILQQIDARKEKSREFRRMAADLNQEYERLIERRATSAQKDA